MVSSSISATSKKIYLPGLNGLRGLAAVAVLVAHLHDEMVSSELLPMPYHKLGRFAVTIFFALSGFLITYLLLKEKASNGRIAIGKFYIRRILRIWPLYFSYLLIAFLVGQMLGIETKAFGFLVTALFAQNFFLMQGILPDLIGHYWSLSIEEQFYLFWPLLIAKIKKPGLAILAFVAIYFSVRMAIFFWLGEYSAPYNFLYTTRLGCMAIGALGAWLLFRGIPANLKKVLFHPAAQIICWVLTISLMLEFLPVFNTLRHQVLAVLSTILMLNLCHNPKPILSLEGRIWTYLGNISFGLYIWHIIFVYVFGKYILLNDWPIIAKIPIFSLLTVACSFATATLSYFYLEKPFLKLKGKYSPLKTKAE